MGSKLLRNRNFHILFGACASLLLGAVAQYLLIPLVARGTISIFEPCPVAPAYAWVSFCSGILMPTAFMLDFPDPKRPFEGTFENDLWSALHTILLVTALVWVVLHTLLPDGGASSSAWVLGVFGIIALTLSAIPSDVSEQTLRSFVTGALIGSIPALRTAFREIWTSDLTGPHVEWYTLVFAAYVIPIQLLRGDRRFHRPIRWIRSQLKLRLRVRRMRENERRLLELESVERRLLDGIIKIRLERHALRQQRVEGKGAYRVQAVSEIPERPIPEEEDDEGVVDTPTVTRH